MYCIVTPLPVFPRLRLSCVNTLTGTGAAQQCHTFTMSALNNFADPIATAIRNRSASLCR